MTPNPYQAPQALPIPSPRFDAPTGSRSLFVLAAAGAGLASLYWAGLTLLFGLGAAFGSTSPLQMFWPVVLVVLYAVRGFQIFQGNVPATRRILWLHGIGAVAAVVQMVSGNVLLIVLQSIKVMIHLFGGTTAFLAFRSATRR
jgi:hypothetical protein